MFILSDYIKGKLLKDLKKNVRFDNISFHFEGNTLVCLSRDFGYQIVGFNELPARLSYNQLFKVTNAQLSHLLQTYKGAREMLKQTDYSSLVTNSVAIRKTEICNDLPYQYEKNGTYYHYISVINCKDNTGSYNLSIYVTKDVLDAHNVDEHIFFDDVSEAYQKKGKNITTDSPLT